jgi:membrane-associated phospholipid phosphatase
MDLTPGPFLRWAARRLDRDAPGGLYLTVGLGGVALFLAAFLGMAEDLVEAASFSIDHAVYGALQAAASPALTRLLWLATLCADTRVMTVGTAVAAIGLLLWGRPRGALFVAGAVGGGSALAALLKDVFVRPRPPASIALVATPESFSFPSGHAMAGLLLLGSLALLLVASRRPAWLKVAGVAAAALGTMMVGVSRVYLGVHWFSDVVASWCLGAALLCAAGAALLAWERFGTPRPVPRFSGTARAWRLAVTIALAGAAVWALAAETLRNPLL